MKVKKTKKQTPIIKSIVYYHNVKREDATTGDYIVIEYLDKEYRTQVINADTKIDVNALDKKIELKEIADTDVITLYNLREQGGTIYEGK